MMSPMTRKVLNVFLLIFYAACLDQYVQMLSSFWKQNPRDVGSVKASLFPYKKGLAQERNLGETKVSESFPPFYRFN